LFSTACLAVATITGKVHLQILSTLNLHRFGGNGVEKRGKLHSKEDLSFFLEVPYVHHNHHHHHAHAPFGQRCFADGFLTDQNM
jgi:hypothetical protein